jgi:hypothetical protein
MAPIQIQTPSEKKKNLHQEAFYSLANSLQLGFLQMKAVIRANTSLQWWCQ